MSDVLDLGQFAVVKAQLDATSPERKIWDLSFLGVGVFYRCYPWDRRCEFVDAAGIGWSSKRRDLVQEDDMNFRGLPTLLLLEISPTA